MKIYFFIILSTSLLLAACSAFPPKNGQPDNPLARKIHGHADITKGEIAPAALYDKMQKGEKLTLLDVRETYEFEETHIPGTNARISVKEFQVAPSGRVNELASLRLGLEAKLKEAGLKKDDQIIVYCRSGTRSRIAAKLMRELGYTNVWELNSGIIHWIEDGFPTESGAAVAAVSNQQSAISSQAKIVFDRTTHDFGKIPQFGGKVQTTFVVKNTGGAELKIGEITTSCSCTEAKIAQSAIPAGNETTLAVTFNPNLHEEPTEKFKRTIFIPANDPENPEAELTIEVDILEGK